MAEKEFKNIVQFYKTHSDKWRGVNLGTAVFDGDKIYLKFDALPIPRKNNFGEMTVEASIVERQERGGFQPPEETGPAESKPEDDDIPF